MLVPRHDIDPATAVRMVEDAAATLIDVREHDEWAAGHAPAAVHIPLGELDPGAYTPQQVLVVVCRSGARSARAAAALAAAGLPVHNLAGGMKAWERAGHPVIRDGATRGTVV